MKERADITGEGALQPLLRDWPSVALSCLEREPAVVRVIVASVRGSAPREPGACMLVDAQGLIGTIGGGHLEQSAVEMARRQLGAPSDAEPSDAEPSDAKSSDAEPNDAEPNDAKSSDAVLSDTVLSDAESSRADPIRVCRVTLGRDLAQCCGGVVELWLERLTRDDRSWLADAASAAQAGCALLTTRATGSRPEKTCRTSGVAELPWRVHLEVDADGAPILRERIDVVATPLWLYGAGHVGRAVVRGLAELPFDVTWIDSRQELLPVSVPSNTRTLHTEHPVAVVGRAPASAYHLVMTHDHGIDFDVCHAILARGEFAWLGLIGSASKAAKFRARLARSGLSSERIARLVCPIGVGGLTSKLPAAIAASVTVQLLQELEHVAERALFQFAQPVLPPLPTQPTQPTLPTLSTLPTLPAVLAKPPQRTDLTQPLSAARRWRASSSADPDCSAENCNSCRARQGIER